jgi:undecaprenyl pyrophosphate phosphatase UppP
MKFYVYLILCVLYLIGVVPAFLYGFELAKEYNNMLIAPIPAVLCCIGFGFFAYLAELNADEDVHNA